MMFTLQKKIVDEQKNKLVVLAENNIMKGSKDILTLLIPDFFALCALEILKSIRNPPTKAF